jgi:ketosteroid isomerase-like protein
MKRHPNEVLAERLWNSIAAADMDQLFEIIDPKAVWIMPGRSPLAGRHEGINGILSFMAHVGQLADRLESTLLEIFVNDRGAVLRYAIHATRAGKTLDTEHLFTIRVRESRIVEARFAPLDQESYDEFWLENELARDDVVAEGGHVATARIVPFRRPVKHDG